MHSVLLALVLLAVQPCVQSAVTLKQFGPVQLRASETLRLTCYVYGYSLSDEWSSVSWVRQSPGKDLEWLCLVFWNDNKHYLGSLKNRLTVSRDTSKNQVYLEMRGMQTVDTGTYYCAGRSQCTKAMWGQDKYQCRGGDSACLQPECYELVTYDELIFASTLATVSNHHWLQPPESL
ncbi:UNVERIFIED_CONTAM: hypothetical protein K2H54_044164 [Gekko kuhli]